MALGLSAPAGRHAQVLKIPAAPPAFLNLPPPLVTRGCFPAPLGPAAARAGGAVQGSRDR